MPFQNSREEAINLVEALRDQIEGTLTSELEQSHKGTIPAHRQRQLDIAKITYEAKVGESPQGISKAPTNIQKVIAGALAYIQLEIAESYYKSMPSWAIGLKADRSTLYSQINRIPQMQDVFTEEAVMLEALKAFSEFYESKTFKSVRGQKPGRIVADNIFQRAFHPGEDKVDVDIMQASIEQFERRLDRYQLINDADPGLKFKSIRQAVIDDVQKAQKTMAAERVEAAKPHVEAQKRGVMSYFFSSSKAPAVVKEEKTDEVNTVDQTHVDEASLSQALRMGSNPV